MRVADSYKFVPSSTKNNAPGRGQTLSAFGRDGLGTWRRCDLARLAHRDRRGRFCGRIGPPFRRSEGPF
jgi:hypothetical protein